MECTYGLQTNEVHDEVVAEYMHVEFDEEQRSRVATPQRLCSNCTKTFFRHIDILLDHPAVGEGGKIVATNALETFVWHVPNGQPS